MANHLTIQRAFTEHPASVGKTWGQHARFALSAAGTLAMAAMAATVHAVVPALFPTTASRAIDRLHARVHHRADGPPGAEPAKIVTMESRTARPAA